MSSYRDVHESELRDSLRAAPAGFMSLDAPPWLQRLGRAACRLAGIPMSEISDKDAWVATQGADPEPAEDSGQNCSRCGQILLHSARARSDGLCGSCSRAATGTSGLADRARAAGLEPSIVLEVLRSPEGRAAIATVVGESQALFRSEPKPVTNPGYPKYFREEIERAAAVPIRVSVPLTAPAPSFAPRVGDLVRVRFGQCAGESGRIEQVDEDGVLKVRLGDGAHTWAGPCDLDPAEPGRSAAHAAGRAAVNRGAVDPSPPINAELATAGFHRIGRLDAVGRRSLWLREEKEAIELCAGREGGDATVRITKAHPLYNDLVSVFAAARFAAEWEDPQGHALDPSFALDGCEASINRVREGGSEHPAEPQYSRRWVRD